MGSTSVKNIKGHKYLYYTCYEHGKRVERYCGKVSPESRTKAKKFELADLDRRRTELNQKIASRRKKGAGI